MAEYTLGGSKAVPVNINGKTLFVEKMMLSCENDIREQGTLNSGQIFTTFYAKSKKLTLKGRIYGKTLSSFVLMSDEQVNRPIPLRIIYKDLNFRDCTINTFTIVDSADDFAEVELTLIIYRDIQNYIGG